MADKPMPAGRFVDEILAAMREATQPVGKERVRVLWKEWLGEEVDAYLASFPEGMTFGGLDDPEATDLGTMPEGYDYAKGLKPGRIEDLIGFWLNGRLAHLYDLAGARVRFKHLEVEDSLEPEGFTPIDEAYTR